MPKFVIIIPTYNRAKTIGRSVRSVLRQKYPRWSILVIDDGSTDDTQSVMESFLDDDRIFYSKKENGGVGSARNAGIKRAISMFEGEDVYFIFLDSDDELCPSALLDMAESIRMVPKKRVFLFGSEDQLGQPAYQMRESEKTLSYQDVLSNKYADGEMIGCFHFSVFSSGKHMFPELVNGGECLLLWDLARQENIVAIRKVVRIYHTESNNSIVRSPLSRKNVSNLDAITRMILAEFGKDLRCYNRRSLSMYYFVYARTRCLLGNRWESGRYFFCGLLAYPLQPKLIILYLVSLFDYSYIINNFLVRRFS